jgi:hypothetical protein
MMRAFELLARRIDVDVSTLIRWFELRSALPPLAIKKLAEETAETSAIYYDVIDDPLETEHGQQVLSQLERVALLLERYIDWRSAVGCMKNGSGYCLINRFGDPISHYAEKPISLRSMLAWSKSRPPISTVIDN